MEHNRQSHHCGLEQNEHKHNHSGCGHEEHTHSGCGCHAHEHTHTHSCSCGRDHGHEDGCCCGHDRSHGDGCGCGCGHDHHHPTQKELPVLIAGAALFAVGLGLSAFHLPGWPAYLAAWLLLGWPIFIQAAKNLVKGHVLDENFLMSIATLAAIFLQEYPEAVGILLFYRAGEYFEHQAADRSRSRIMEAVDLRPQTVTLSDGTVIPADQAKPGDLLLVRPGDRIGLDGTVVSGESRVDTAPITGEPVPVAVKPGDPVTSGCINTQSALVIRVDAPLSESMVSRILRAVEGAAAQKPRIQRFISRFAQVYTPAVVGAALAVAVIPSLMTGDWNYWIYTATSFLVMSCPCALVLSVPLAFFCGIGAGSKGGILFKDGAAMEALARVKVAALDKTGTLTQGDFRVQEYTKELLTLCAACEQYSTHPVGVSICARAKELGLTLAVPEEVTEIPGMGIRAVLAGEQILCGNASLLESAGILVPTEAGTRVHVAKGSAYLGSILIADTVKPDAVSAVAELKKLGLIPVMLTGDREETAAAVGEKTGIFRIFARLLPEQKLSALQSLREEMGAVLFVGDGINDAPVLAGADVGAAMGAGADAAIEAADVVFLRNRAADIPRAVKLAKRTRQIAWQNVCFALGFKLLVMILGLLGFADLWLAVFADSGVAALCVLNAIRLTKTK